MPEEFLHRHQVGAPIEHVRRERVSQGVDRKHLEDAALPNVERIVTEAREAMRG